jgi:hypothetical protein
MTEPRPDLPEADYSPMDPDYLLDELQEAQVRAAQAERALARLQGSLTTQVGQLVIDAGQSPARLIALPFALVRMRRSRRQLRRRRSAQPVLSVDVAPRDVSLRWNAERLLLPRRTVTRDDRPTLVVIAPEPVAQALAARAHVSIAMPHDAASLVRSLDPDAVIVHAHAGPPGSPWFPLGTPGEAVRERSLIELRDVCRRLGRPIVLLSDPITAPGLTAFAETCDRDIDVSQTPRVLDLIADLIGGSHG